MKKNIAKKSTIIITPIDYKPTSEPSESSFSKGEKFNPRKSCLLSKMAKKDEISSREEYDETIRVGDKHHMKMSKNFNSATHISPPYFRYYDK